jgi:hypothetical protein
MWTAPPLTDRKVSVAVIPEDEEAGRTCSSGFNLLPPVKNMKLVNTELLERFHQVGSQETESNPLVIAKFFNPTGAGTWYATEYDPVARIFFGFVSIFGDHNDEWGYFSLDELESFRGRFGLGIERDMFFSEKRAREIEVIR